MEGRYTKEQWIELMGIENREHYLVGLRNEIGFKPMAEEVLFVEPQPNPWLDNLLHAKANQINALFEKRGYRFGYIPALAMNISPDLLEYNRPGTPFKHIAERELNEAVQSIYSHIFDCALTPLPQAPMLIRYKKTFTESSEILNALHQGRKPNYVFSYRQLPDAQDESALMDFFEKYVAGIGDERVYYSMAQPAEKKGIADYYFNSRVKTLEEEIKARVDELRQLGVTELVIDELFRAPLPKPSRLTIDSDFRLFLTDYNNREIKMTVLPKVLYFFYLNHPEGVTFKELSDHTNELLGLYQLASNRLNLIKMHMSIKDLTDSTKNSVNEKASLIRSAFMREFDEKIVEPYILTSDKDLRKKIMIDRSLVLDESKLIITHARMVSPTKS